MLTVRGSGLSGTYLKSERFLEALNGTGGPGFCPPGLSPCPPVPTVAVLSYFWGITFDLEADRSIHLTAFNILARETGPHSNGYFYSS